MKLTEELIEVLNEAFADAAGSDGTRISVHFTAMGEGLGVEDKPIKAGFR